MKIEYRQGLIFTEMKLRFKGKSKIIENVVIDTGAAETIISPDVVDEIGIFAEINDTVNSFYGVGGSLHNFFSKNVDSIEMEELELKDLKLDFGIIDPRGEINGLIGLDILIKIGAIIDLKNLNFTVTL
ncbi:aspartyl protease family protein [Herbivorax sp. ANBcel31]|uniref:retroviral-like aspartic protease family protein n=1 Tax=Herbivorax sp. ANBcel31 TaxID=3069754 RepID=UPI0027AFEE30|nr:retroviral-like aspartic protease family protein [Herbivorax sp. ANBcel31]MDQ2088124.1 aspartyl protease family protein [Herbivorax sp. ANBcel31]